MRWVLLCLVPVVCCGCQQNAQPKPTTMRDVQAQTARMPDGQAWAVAASKAQPGETIGDLLLSQGLKRYKLQAESIVVNLDGRGTKRIPPKMRPHLVKLLVKESDDPVVAGELLNSKDAAPVFVEAEIGPFLNEGEKIDVKITAYDPTVNLEGGLLIETPLQHYVRMVGPVQPGFSTRSGLVSAGTMAFARGEVTLNAGTTSGTRIAGVAPHVGYLPGGGMMHKAWGYRLMLKKGDANTAVMIEKAYKARFGKEMPSMPNVTYVAIGMPRNYRGYPRRYLDVVLRIRVRPSTREDRRAEAREFIGRLSSSNPQVRYDAETTLEAYGREVTPMLLEACESGSAFQRQSALRVLAFLGDQRAREPLVRESRRAGAAYRRQSAHLMALLRGAVVEQRLIEMLSEKDPLVRFEAILALEWMRAENAPVRNIYSESHKNAIIHLVGVDGAKAVVVKPSGGIRRIALFGSDIRIRDGFRGEAGPVSLSVHDGVTEVRHKRTITRKPRPWRTTELYLVINGLDRVGVSINDIISLVAMMDTQRKLNARVTWTE